jgi:hypothetical protein
MALTGHSGQSSVSLLWARLTGRYPFCRYRTAEAHVADFCGDQWLVFSPPLTAESIWPHFCLVIGM